ncbi:phage tail protein [Sphingobacterium faecium]|uniref:phage tail protein n=1 Tax=Sphingobacterium faecium TaxID=34087 RepID=UPI00320BB404
MKIKVFRKTEEIAQLPLNAASFTKKIMGEHSLNFSFTSPELLDLHIGDHLEYKGEAYIINQEPEVRHDHFFTYEVKFEGERHTLSRFLLKQSGKFTFSYFGTTDEYLFMLLDCLNDVDEGWTKGYVDDLGRVGLSFDEVDCFSALTMIADEFKGEWDIVGKTISLKKTIGTMRDFPLSYGKGNGLYALKRQSINDKSIVTRAYAVGGSKNLPEGMVGNLKLDGYAEKNVELYGIREGIFKNEEIFPKGKGWVTGVGQIDKTTFIIKDKNLDYDINEVKVDSAWKIVFTSGDLQGNEFDILSYDHTTQTIQYKVNNEGNEYLFPNEFAFAKEGDTYIIIGIRLPQRDIDSAIAELEAGRLKYLEDNSVPRVMYDLEVDVLEMKRRNAVLNPGDIVTVSDEKIGMNENIRVMAVSYPAHYPDVLEQGMTFRAEVGNDVTYTLMQKIQNDIKGQKEITNQYNKQNSEMDRRNVQALSEFKEKVLDPEGNLQQALIEALVGWFGTSSMYYDLDGISMSLNDGGDSNSFSLTAGRLIHKVFKIEGLSNSWSLLSFSVSNLEPLKPYYLAAKCSKTSLTGEWVLTETQFQTEEDAGYWYFNFGVLSSVLEGGRSFKSTKGFTMISGGEIETDVITAFMINVQRLFAQVVTVGSNGYDNAGISGLADGKNYNTTGGVIGDNPLKSVRFWAGDTEDNKHKAPFNVLNDGSMKAEKGNVGGFEITQNSLKVGSNPNGSSWDINSQTVFMTQNYFLLRDNGAVAGERRELSWNLYKDGASNQGRAAAASIFNTINKSTEFNYSNIALEIEASGASENYALHVNKGVSKLRGVELGVQIVNSANTQINNETTFVVINGLTGGVINPNLFMPSNAKIGRPLTIKNNSGTGCILQANTGNGQFLKTGGGLENPKMLLNNNVISFFFDGTNWIEYNQH